MKAGTAYEYYVKEIYEAILRFEGVENIKVEHDVKIVGSSGVERQVDVYWEFKSAGIIYKVVVECKDYNSKVPLEKIDAFYSKIKDISGATGVFVSKNGYQSGAIELARKYGIQLKEIRKPNDDDWDGYMRNIVLEQHLLFVTNIKTGFLMDKEWGKDNGIEPGTFSETADKVTIEDKVTNKVFSLKSIVSELNTNLIGKNQKKEIEYEDAYVCAGEKRIKISKLILKYDVVESIQITEINGDDFIKGIIHDVIDDSTLSVHIDGQVAERDKIRKEN